MSTFDSQVSKKEKGVIPCDILVPHIDSRVKIIDSERPGASPCGIISHDTLR
jgi:hypothetical protein